MGSCCCDQLIADRVETLADHLLVLGCHTSSLRAFFAGVRERETGDRIVWSQFVDRSFSGARIVSARADGSDPRTLTNPGPGVRDIDPVWSPDPHAGRRRA